MKPEIKVITTDEVTNGYIQKALENFKAEIPFTIIGLDKAGAQVMGDKFPGFENLIPLRDTKEPVVIVSFFFTDRSVKKDKRWLWIFANSNFAFLEFPFTLEELKLTLKNAGKGINDQLAGELYDTDYKVSTHQLLQHRLGTPNNRSTNLGSKEEWTRLAESVFGPLSFEELVKAVDDFKETSSSTFAGREFPDVCVDVEGTLLNKDGTLNHRVVFLVGANAGTEKPITVWTGGDVITLQAKLHELGVFWKVASKHLFKGAKFSVVIDDLPEEEFKAQYGIEFEKYIHYSEYIEYVS